LLSTDFMPHGYCYLWDPRMVWLHVISDGLIALSYYCIPVVLIYFVRKNRDIPFNRIFWMFGTFILACGTTHLMEIWTIWHGSYLLAGVLKAITAVVSVITAAMLIPLVPKVISLPGRMHLQETNRKLAEEIAERKRFDAPIDRSLRRRVTVGFTVAVLLTLFVGFSSWRGAGLAEQDAFWVSHTHEVIEAIDRANRDVIEAVTSARAFALTGQEPLLVHYQTARDSIYQDEDALRRLTADNLSQQRRLNELGPQVSAALQFAQDIISKRRKVQTYSGDSDALETERLVDLVRATTRDMDGEERRLLNQRTQKTRAGRGLVRLLAIAGAVLGVGLWSLARFAVNREIEVSGRARTQVNTLNAELEQRVAQRTAALQSEVTERKRAERASETALREMADQKFALDQHAIVAITDVQGTITYVNEKFCDISQYDKADLIGQNHRILNSGHHAKEFFQRMYRTISSGQVWHGEIKNRAKDGSIYWVSTTIVPTLGAEGKPRQYVAIRADITERKSADEQIQNLNKEMERRNRELESQAIELQKTRDGLELRVKERTEQLADANHVLEQSNLELQQFAYVASHDLQSPLRSISGFVQLLKSEYQGKLDAQADDWIRRTVLASGQMQTMIRDVLAYSRVDSRSRPFTPTAFLDVFNDAVALLESSIHDAGGQVACGDLPVVMGDRSQLVQLMQNLIGNGLKYHGDKAPAVYVSALRNGNEWVFSVRDNGIGIEPKYYDRIFEIFKRLHDQKEYPGTGIGLAVCRRVVTRHGGRIWLESEAGSGSTFHFTLPEGTDKTI
jgi:PAS domain S-box-containing protein